MTDYFQFPKTPPAYAIIWLHGLGASGRDMAGIVSAMQLQGLFIRHLFLDAPTRPVTINQGAVMPAWYDILGLQFSDREDEAGIKASGGILQHTIQQLIDSGFSASQIILAGFSQGAALAIYTALQRQERLGGVILLSGYLPLARTLSPKLVLDTPMFIGYGRYDPIVMPAWTQLMIEALKQWGYQAVQVENYPIEHRVCPEELTALSAWIKGLTHDSN